MFSGDSVRTSFPRACERLTEDCVFRDAIIIINLVRLGVKIDDKDKDIILLCYSLGSYDHSYMQKNTLSVLMWLLVHFCLILKEDNVEERTQGDNLYVKEGQDHGRNNGKGGSGNKNFKSMNHKTDECYSCKYIFHLKRDYAKRKHGSPSSANFVQTGDSGHKAYIPCVSSNKCTYWLLTLVILTTRHRTRNDSLHSGHVILGLCI